MNEFKHTGRNLEIFEPVVFINKNNIWIGDFCRVSEFVLVNGGQGTYVGNFVHIANHASIVGGGECFIGDFVGICAGVRIITGSDDISGEGIPSPLVPSEFRSFYRSRVMIEKHVFIGTNSIIHPNIRIGEGTVIGSGSVVTKNLEPWGVYVGNPARRIKDRNFKKIKSQELDVYQKMQVDPSVFSHNLPTNTD